MDYCEGGEMFYHIKAKRFNEIRAKFYAAQVILALEYLHHNELI